MEDVQKEVVEHQRVATVRRIPNLAFEWKASYGNHRLVYRVRSNFLRWRGSVLILKRLSTKV